MKLFKRLHYKRTVILLPLIGVLFLYQNCSKGFKPVSSSQLSSNTKNGGQSTTPPPTAPPPAADMTAPSAPATLQVAANSSSMLTLSWAAATDNVAVTGYRVIRDGTTLVNLGNVLSYQDMGLSASTSYTYQVRALDAAGNASSLSPLTSATTMSNTPPPPTGGTITMGGVNWLDPLNYQKPAFLPLDIPDESTTQNKYWVDLTNGSGSTCSQANPCKGLINVAGKPGTAGGPAYIYVKGTGPIGSPVLYGSEGNEVVIKTWDNFTAALISGRNNWTTRIQHVLFDGGPNLNIKFINTNGGQFDPSIYFNANGAGIQSHITFYRTFWSVTGMGEYIAQWGQVDNLSIINSEFTSAGSSDSGNQHHIYLSGASNYGPSAHIYFRHNIFRDTPGEMIELRMFQAIDDLVIDGNVFRNIGKGTCSNSWACRSAITLSTAQSSGAITNARISNNLMWDLGEGAVRCWAGNAQIYNNTVHDWGMGSPANGGYGQWAFFGYSRDGQCSLRNNIIHASGTTANGHTKIPFDTSPNIVNQASNNICLSGQNCGANSQVYNASTMTTPFSTLATDQNNPNYMMPSLTGNAMGTGINYFTIGIQTNFNLVPRPASGGSTVGAF